MLTKIEHRALEFVSQLASVSLTLPFAWSRRGFVKLRTNRSIWFAIAGYASTILTGFHLGFLIVRALPGCGYSKAELAAPLHYSIFLHGTQLVSYITLFGMQVQAIFKSNELAIIVNQLLHFNRLHGKHYLDKEFGDPTIVSKIIFAMLLGLAPLVWILLALNILIPTQKFNLYSALPEEWQTTWMLVICLSIQVFSMVKAVIVDWFTFYVGYAYITTNRFWLTQIRLEWMSNPAEFDFKGDVIRMYRALTVMNTLYNNGFSSTLFPTLKTGVEVCALICLYGIFRLYHSTMIWVYAVFALFGPVCIAQLMGTIMYMASVAEFSEEVVRHFNIVFDGNADVPASNAVVSRGRSGRQRQQKILRKILKSCKIMHCRIGLLFFVEKSTKLAYISLLLHTFISMLVAW